MPDDTPEKDDPTSTSSPFYAAKTGVDLPVSSHIIFAASEIEPYSVSLDGGYIAYQFFGPKANANDVWALPMFGDRKPFPVVSTPFDEVDPAISPDGKWLAYLSNESGQYEVYIKTFPSGEGKWQVSTTGSRGLPVWRRDGKELYFLSLGGKLTAVDVQEKGASLELGTPQELFQAPGP